MEPWDAISADREILATYLGALTPQEWTSKTWCTEWTVKDVVAHLLVSPTMSKGQIFRAFAGAGFNLDKMSAKLVAGMANMSAQAMTDTTRSTANVRSAPPGLKPVGVLAEVLVHAQDIAGALGKPVAFPADHGLMALDHLKNVQPVLGCKKRIAGLKLQATDASWSTGDGPLVEGTVQSLLSAITGRKQSLEFLTGPGVATLSSRN